MMIHAHDNIPEVLEHASLFGLAKKSAIISPVMGRYMRLIFCLSILSLMKKDQMLRCRERFPADCCPFFSIFVAL
jgi:hypothetical protein